jgi:hypothetical protein
VDEGWFPEILKSKKCINQLLESKKKAKMPKIIRQDSRTEYPKELWVGRSKEYEEVMKPLYKSFLLNMDEEVTKEKVKIN